MAYESNDPRKPFEKRDFSISLADAKRICDGLELAAAYDKTRIYYELKRWINEKQYQGVSHPGAPHANALIQQHYFLLQELTNHAIHNQQQRRIQMTPISREAALARIAAAGITVEQAVKMSDNELLRFPSIGRRTLYYIRNWIIEA